MNLTAEVKVAAAGAVPGAAARQARAEAALAPGQALVVSLPPRPEADRSLTEFARDLIGDRPQALLVLTVTRTAPPTAPAVLPAGWFTK